LLKLLVPALSGFPDYQPKNRPFLAAAAPKGARRSFFVMVPSEHKDAFGEDICEQKKATSLF